MNVQTTTKILAIGSMCVVCVILCGCYEQQSSDKVQYSVSTRCITDVGNGPREVDYQQDALKHYDPVVQDALDYVDQYSTAWMKRYISRGKLVAGMNQKEVLASLYATHFRDGVPVTSKTYNSKYGRYETWIIGGSSQDEYFSFSPPRYALDFTDYILTCIHEPKNIQAQSHRHLARAD